MTTGAKTVAYTYEPGRNAITSITNEVGSTTVSAYTYTNNALGQRTARSQSGAAFAASASETFGYNSKGEVTSTTHDVDTARDTAFAYDGIGNRNTATFAGLTTDYTANLLNQYTEVDPGTPATPTYDDDGNLIGNGTDREFSYDGENRLVEVRDASNTLLATYTYDGQGRRAKRVTTGAAPQGASEEVYLYDGWNRVATYDASSGLLNTQTWGRDLSGTLEGAGGVGGLLGVQESVGPHAGNYTLQYDANGNVSEVLTASGAIAAHYEYDAFGDEVVSTGSYAAVNPWRFSTKPVDAETGYSYYGYRYYNPDTGRWLNRDPLGERGGVNLYGFLSNAPIGAIDALGLAWWEDLIPVYGSAKRSVDDFNNGQYVWGSVNAALAVSDIFLIKGIATARVKGAWKVGGVSWSAASRWYKTTRGLESAVPLHHWMIHQRGVTAKFMTKMFGLPATQALINQPWNLLPMRSRAWHNAVHGAYKDTPQAMNYLERLFNGTPGWAQNVTANVLTRIAEALRNNSMNSPQGVKWEMGVEYNIETGETQSYYHVEEVDDVGSVNLSD